MTTVGTFPASEKEDIKVLKRPHSGRYLVLGPENQEFLGKKRKFGS